MMEAGARTYGVSEIAEVIGEKPRAVQFWADMGVLKPLDETFRKGRGVHRRFSSTELQYARAAANISLTNAPLTEVLAVVEHLRKFSLHGVVAGMTLFLDKCSSDRESLSKRSVVREFLSFLEIADFYYSRGQPVSVVLAYSRNQNVPPEVGFWTRAVSVLCDREIRTFATFLTDDLVGFKAVDFSEVARQLETLCSVDDSERNRELIQRFMHQAVEQFAEIIRILHPAE